MKKSDVDGAVPGATKRAAPNKRPAPAKKEGHRTQAGRSEVTQNKLLAAAVKVLTKRGYLGFTTQEAANLAKVSRGAPLHHFQTTEAFLLAALERLFEMGKRESEKTVLRLVASGPISADDILSALFNDAREFFFGPQFLTGIDALNSSSKNSKMRMRVRDLADRYRPTVETMWRDLFVAQGFSEEAADDIVWLTMTAVRGVAIRTTVTCESARVERTLELGLGLVRDHMHRIAGVKSSDLVTAT